MLLLAATTKTLNSQYFWKLTYRSTRKCSRQHIFTVWARLNRPISRARSHSVLTSAALEIAAWGWWMWEVNGRCRTLLGFLWLTRSLLDTLFNPVKANVNVDVVSSFHGLLHVTKGDPKLLKILCCCPCSIMLRVTYCRNN